MKIHTTCHNRHNIMDEGEWPTYACLSLCQYSASLGNHTACPRGWINASFPGIWKCYLKSTSEEAIIPDISVLHSQTGMNQNASLLSGPLLVISHDWYHVTHHASIQRWYDCGIHTESPALLHWKLSPEGTTWQFRTIWSTRLFCDSVI